MPFTVRLARWVLLAAGTATLLGGLAGLAVHTSVTAAYVLAYDDAGPARARLALATGATLGVAAFGCCLYAASRLRTRPTRAPAWLVCALLFAGLAPVLFGGGTIIAPRIAGHGVSPSDLATDLQALAPRWYPPTLAALACFGTCAALAVAVLLAFPSAFDDRDAP